MHAAPSKSKYVTDMGEQRLDTDDNVADGDMTQQCPGSRRPMGGQYSTCGIGFPACQRGYICRNLHPMCEDSALKSCIGLCVPPPPRGREGGPPPEGIPAWSFSPRSPTTGDIAPAAPVNPRDHGQQQPKGTTGPTGSFGQGQQLPWGQMGGLQPGGSITLGPEKGGARNGKSGGWFGTRGRSTSRMSGRVRSTTERHVSNATELE
jgi:hypothetical protein